MKKGINLLMASGLIFIMAVSAVFITSCDEDEMEPECTVGATCDDGNNITTNDKYDADCDCVGTPICTVGASCDDGNADTENDMFNSSCVCEGTQIAYHMVLVNKETGMFNSVNLSNGDLTAQGSITHLGSPLLYIRDVVYNPGDSKLYVTLNGGPGAGQLLSVNTATLQATLINSNEDFDWDAIAEWVISGGKLLGAGYLNEPNLNHALITIEFNGIQGAAFDFEENMVEYDPCCGMGLTFGNSTAELLVSDDDEIFKCSLTGDITMVYDNFTQVGFTDPIDVITSLEKDEDGNLFGLTSDGQLIGINLTTETITLIDELPETNNKYHGLSLIPESIF